MANVPPLCIPPTSPSIDIPFSSDKLGRAALAEVLSGYVGRLKFGAVVAVDAEWGQGKTWFAQNWKQHLESNGHRAIAIDAFQADYMEDPFLLIVGEILEIIRSQSSRKTFVETATNVALAIAPAALKAVIRGGGHTLLGISNLDEKVGGTIGKLAETAEESLGKFLEERIKQYHDGKKSIATFRKNLASFAAESEKPLVIIIDELDRCKPEFAVSLLERIKHFFDVENVVFVLFLNKKQMHNAIKGVYGPATDANTYLEKFLNFTFTLEQPRFGKMRPFVISELAKYQIPSDAQVNEFVDGLCALTDAFNFTPRQVERSLALLSLAYPIKTGAILLAELVVLKISRPDLLDGLLRGDRSLQMELLQILIDQERKNTDKHVSTQELKFLITVHNALLGSGDDEHALILQQMYNLKPGGVRRDYAEVIKLLNMMVR